MKLAEPSSPSPFFTVSKAIVLQSLKNRRPNGLAARWHIEI